MVDPSEVPSPSSKGGPIRVMLVDDSRVIRRVIRGMISRSDYNIEVTTFAIDGIMAIEALKANPVDIIILDVEMPRMNGIEAIPKLLEVKPDVKIIMASILTTKNADRSLEAIKLGAVDYVAKPSSSMGEGEKTTEDFERILLEKISIYGSDSGKPQKSSTDINSVQSKDDITHKISDILPRPGFRPQAISIGSSTGGPQVLFKVAKVLSNKHLQIPVFITQHMPKEFTEALAKMLTTQTGLSCVEAESGMKVQPGMVYIAPGGYHMTVKSVEREKIIKLTDGPPVNFSKPAVDVMLDSLIDAYEGRLLGVILTGMGHDGRDASLRLQNSGGMVIAQNKESSAVWGMPAAIVKNDIHEYVFTDDDMGEAIYRIAGRI